MHSPEIIVRDGSHFQILSSEKQENKKFVWRKVVAKWCGYGRMPLWANEEKTFLLDRRGKMDTLTVFKMGEANRDKPLMVFDWDKAARLIKKRGAQFAYAGLQDDWDWTGGCILESGNPDLESYTYLASRWAKPELWLGFYEEGVFHHYEFYDCYIMEDQTEWRSDTKWPQSAIDILNG